MSKNYKKKIIKKVEKQTVRSDTYIFIKSGASCKSGILDLSLGWPDLFCRKKINRWWSENWLIFGEKFGWIFEFLFQFQFQLHSFMAYLHHTPRYLGINFWLIYNSPLDYRKIQNQLIYFSDNFRSKQKFSAFIFWSQNLNFCLVRISSLHLKTAKIATIAIARLKNKNRLHYQRNRFCQIFL